ncbi:ABC transporter ATP-binding protein [Sedimentitalea nanhaiensis]|uniref:Peptide/nickel transport system ATP-binding protein n=2 Tax=Sedimentitalea nanhaiensis TaxID=999627 RepID=A0A1I7BWJ9_9RHOB|nr:oligopeptide/dipeptide ABC transporter ATP-binding protein [Sedimentitalea nanhaiensis]SFT91491.1 peptide/nickel transport system ATP-binding protein [Sedimentitalea nanhaiensis]
MSDLLDVQNLSVRFGVRRKGGFFAKPTYLTAVDDISFTVRKGETLAIVGESGSGKTTAALAIARLVSGLTSGKILLEGRDLLPLDREDLKDMRQKVQVIFQDPYSSLNPRKRAEDIVREPLDSLTDKSISEKREIVDGLFKAVGLHPEQKRLFPHQFSGGQRQRIGIARALSTQPEVIICDEPVSALDVAVQAQILNLLRRLQTEFGLTYVFISHDLGVVQHMCDSVAVMYMGKIVEHADRLSLFNNPLHPYTAALLSAVPSVDPMLREQSRRILIPGDPPDPLDLPKGCRFASRCPVAEARCRDVAPRLKLAGSNHRAACHLVEDETSPLAGIRS